MALAAWTAFGLILLAVACSVAKLAGDEGGEGGSPLAVVRSILPTEPACLWHFGLTLAAAVAGLVWCVEDPGRPYWAAGVMLAGAVGAGGAALWRRQIADIVVSGVLINLAGNVAWIAWRDHDLVGLIETNVICLAAGAAVWTIIQAIAPRRVANIPWEQNEHAMLT